jgi:pimeloyl-ACP methyl ester carboxylesterase
MREFDLRRPAGGVLHAYDTGPTGSADELVVFWHGGTPNTGEPPEPLLAAASEAGVRFLGADRPGYGGTTRDPEASISDVVPDVLAVADALGVDRFAVLGHSGGGPRALACAALAAERVLAAVVVSSPAPADAAGLDHQSGMAPGIARQQDAIAGGREALNTLLGKNEFDESAFTAGRPRRPRRCLVVVRPRRTGRHGFGAGRHGGRPARRRSAVGLRRRRDPRAGARRPRRRRPDRARPAR